MQIARMNVSIVFQSATKLLTFLLLSWSSFGDSSTRIGIAKCTELETKVGMWAAEAWDWVRLTNCKVFDYILGSICGYILAAVEIGAAHSPEIET